MKQNTPEWRQARCGMITASNFQKVLTKPRSKSEKWGQTAMTYMYQLVGERLTDIPAEEISSKHLDWGNRHEPVAKDEYGLKTGIDPEDVGFVVYSDQLGDHLVGCSPDGLVGVHGCVEIKCPSTTKEHIKTIVSEEVPPQYVAQVQGVLWITDRAWCDFVSFDPRMPYHRQIAILRVQRDEAYIEELRNKVLNFEVLLMFMSSSLIGRDHNADKEERKPDPVGIS